DVHRVGLNFWVILCHVAETARHQTTGLAQHIWFLDERHAFAAGFLRVIESFFTNISASLHAHDACGERDILKALLLPLFHLRISAQGGVNRFRQRKELNAAIHALGIFPEHDLIDRYIFPAWVRDLVPAIVQRVAGITFARPHVRVEMEELPQSYDRREIAQAFALEFRTQFLFGLVLRLAGDR